MLHERYYVEKEKQEKLLSRPLRISGTDKRAHPAYMEI